MSYDIHLEADLGGPTTLAIGDWNCTSNLARMWREAGADLAEFHGKLASECIPLLKLAIDVLRADPERFEAMNPENGWGSYEDLIPALGRLLALFESAPVATVHVWR